MSTYQQTVPAQMCYFWYDACINATIGTNGEGDRQAQFACRTARDSQCGNITIDESGDNDDSSSASASATSTGASQTSGSSGSQTSSTASSTASAAAGGAGANFAIGTPALVGGLLAIFGLAL